MAETAIVSFHTLSVGFPLPTISKNSLYTLFCSLILDHGVLLKLSISGSQNSYFEFPARYFSSSLSSTCDNQVLTSSDESPGRTIPIRSLDFSDSRVLNLYNPSKISSSGIFVIDNRLPSHLESTFLNIVISKNNSEQVGVVFDRIMGSSDPEVIVDQVSNLSAAKETVLFLGLLFLQTDSPFELAIMDEFVQCRSNPRTKYFKNSAVKYHE